MKRTTIDLNDINPFDATHFRTDGDPGFLTIDKFPDEHLSGARLCAELLGRGEPIRPIAVVASELVPEELRGDEPWQRIDGFKRYWGHKMAGRREIACVVFDDYKPGCQHGLSMTDG